MKSPREYSQDMWITHISHANPSQTAQASPQANRDSLGEQRPPLSLEGSVQVGMCCTLPNSQLLQNNGQIPISLMDVRPGFMPPKHKIPNTAGPSLRFRCQKQLRSYIVLLSLLPWFALFDIICHHLKLGRPSIKVHISDFS